VGDAVVVCSSCGAKNRVPAVAAGSPRCAKCHADLPWLVEVGDDDFAGAVATKRLVLVDLWAPWCGPCRMVAPVLEKLSDDFAGTLKVVKVNVDENQAIPSKYGIRGIPTLMLFRNGAVVDTKVGALSKSQLTVFLDSHL